MAILKLQPACRETIWGGQRLRKDYHMQYELSLIHISEPTRH